MVKPLTAKASGREDGEFLPYGRQCIHEDDINAVKKVLQSDFLTTGPTVESFEQKFAETVGVTHAVACANGTAALHLAAMAIGLGAGDQVVVPSITFLATANVAAMLGAEVVFADVDADNGLLSEATLAEAIDRADPSRLKAVFLVHLRGQTVDHNAVEMLATKHGLRVIEDASHALGTVYKKGTSWHKVGACDHCDLATFSFHPVKTIACGEGGMVTTTDPALARAARMLRNHGITRNASKFAHRAEAFDDGEINPWYYEMPFPGLNYRLSDIHAALGNSQLNRLDSFVARRQELSQLYLRELVDLAPVVTPIARRDDCKPALHLFVVKIDFAALGISRRVVMERLRAAGIGSQVHYIPVHRQFYYAQLNPGLKLPGADAYYKQCLSLPLYPSMRDEDIARIAKALRAAIGGR